MKRGKLWLKNFKIEIKRIPGIDELLLEHKHCI
jgi:hypothetical protein